ncbi:MAG: alpha/beta fold hydrolase, partial [bacterium]
MGPARTEGRATIAGRTLEYTWIGLPSSRAPLIFLHEGLGSIELWREFPETLCLESDRSGLLFSRYGNGWSEVLTEPRQPDYMHVEAKVVFPELLAEVVGRASVLIGHSDGASISLIYAGMGNDVDGLVLIAPHVFVEVRSIAAIAAVREDFGTTDLAERMAKYHRDPEATFRGWKDIWLSPSFRGWNIEDVLPAVTCPILLIQGDEDEYGTEAQLDSIDSQVKGPTTRLMVKETGHWPHLD